MRMTGVVLIVVLALALPLTGCATGGAGRSIAAAISQVEQAQAVYGKEIEIKAIHYSAFAGRTEITYKSRYRAQGATDPTE